MGIKKRIGSWLTLSHPAIAEIMAKSGFDWLAVDLEHSVITIAEAEALIRVIQLCGVSPWVRITSNDPDQIKRVLDAGAHGVIVPMVLSSDDVHRAVAAVKYPPIGSRGVGLARAQGYGSKFHEYYDWSHQNTGIIVQIEHIEAVKQIDAIFSAYPLDGFIIGPYDLTGSMGIPGQFEHPEFLKVLKSIENAAIRHQMPSGIHIIEPDIKQLTCRISQGYHWIAYSLDIRMLDVACRTALSSVEALSQVSDEREVLERGCLS